MAFNEVLARRTLGVIKAHPELHNQGDWRCNSGMCFAGWASQLSGVEWANDTLDPYGMAFNQVIDPDDPDHTEHVQYVAKRLLGLSADDSYTLFRGSNSIEDLGRMVNNLAAGRSISDDYDDDDDYEDDDDEDY